MMHSNDTASSHRQVKPLLPATLHMPTKVLIYRRKDDPVALRASIGGSPEEGYYCTFRGDRAAVYEMLQIVTAVMAHAPDNLPLDDQMFYRSSSPGGGKTEHVD
jgi:hypothetical protein